MSSFCFGSTTERLLMIQFTPEEHTHLNAVIYAFTEISLLVIGFLFAISVYCFIAERVTTYIKSKPQGFKYHILCTPRSVRVQRTKWWWPLWKTVAVFASVDHAFQYLHDMQNKETS